MTAAPGHEPDTTGAEYTAHLVRLESVAWKRRLRVQAPYRWNLRRLRPGFMLDIGCGIGRNLVHNDGIGIGVDHNPWSVRLCRERGLKAYTPSEFRQLATEGSWSFDSLLFAHIIEHMRFDAAVELVAEHLTFLRPAGQVIFITPQERGFRKEPSHVDFADFEHLARLARAVGLRVMRNYSFPFPRVPFGSLFPYNEFVVVARRE